MARLFWLYDQEGLMAKNDRKYSTHRQVPEEVAVTAFKDSCLRLIDRVHRTREEIVVTKYGKPVAKLVAFDEGKAPLFGHLAGSTTVHGDIVAPLDVAWDAEG
jgi:antitoxin (DNA-binding transcriptional repressor) of toxin-antitoxin stability system